MKLCTFIYDGSEQWGALSPDGDSVCPASALGIQSPSLQDHIIRASAADWRQFGQSIAACPGGIPLDAVRLLAPLPQPRQDVLVMENNYCADEAERAAFDAQRAAGEPLLPIYFYKKATLANRDGGVIPSYAGHVETLDYQAELCAVLGRDARQVPAQEADQYILGYIVINNVIARNLTVKHRRPYIATSLDGFLPMSPYIVTADEFANDAVFRVQSFVNGQPRQDATTALLKFTPQYTIADLSRYGVLKAGTLLTTGTPFGSGKDFAPPRFLKKGDTVTCAVEGVGSVTNTIG